MYEAGGIIISRRDDIVLILCVNVEAGFARLSICLDFGSLYYELLYPPSTLLRVELG